MTPDGAHPDARFVIVGRIRRAHGVQGELVVEPYTDATDLLLGAGCRVIAGDTHGDLSVPRKDLHVSESSPLGDGLLVRFDEIDEREVAQQWRNRFLLVPAEEVPPPDEGEIYLHDLVGLRVESVDGAELGSVTAFYELAQGLMLEVKDAGRDFLLPYRDEFIRHVDQERRTIIVDLPAGFLE